MLKIARALAVSLTALWIASNAGASNATIQIEVKVQHDAFSPSNSPGTLFLAGANRIDHFHVGIAQTVQWTATFDEVTDNTGHSTGPEGGGAFALLPLLPDGTPDIAGFKTLWPGRSPPGTNPRQKGSIWLDVGDYKINWDNQGEGDGVPKMGPGTYAITWETAIGLVAQPRALAFPDQLTDVYNTKTIAISTDGPLPVTISPPVFDPPSPSYFGFDGTGLTFGSHSGSLGNLKVTFNTTGISVRIPTPYTATIRLKGTGVRGGPVPDLLVPVSGTVIPRLPNLVLTDPVDKDGVAHVGTANPAKHEQVKCALHFKNIGTAELQFTAPVVFSNDTVENIFAMTTSPVITAQPVQGEFSIGFTFTPAAQNPGQDRDYKGHLVLYTNDPDHQLMIVPFAATGHIPVPRVALNPSNFLNFGRVPLGFQKTLPLTLRNAGDAELTANLLANNPQTSPFHYPFTRYTIAANGTPAVLNVTFRPTAAIPAVQYLTVVSNDPSANRPRVEALGQGTTAPPPLAVMLVLDRSLEMGKAGDGEQLQIQRALEVATGCVNFLRPGTDLLGMIRYGMTSQPYLALKPLSDAQKTSALDLLKPAAAKDPNALLPAGQADLFQALTRASTELANGSPTHKGKIVVVTTYPSKPTTAGLPSADPAWRLRVLAQPFNGNDVYLLLLRSPSSTAGSLSGPNIYVDPGHAADPYTLSLERFLVDAVATP